MTEIVNVAAGLAPELAAQLLERAEGFVREQLPDGSARRRLSSLLLLKMKSTDINRNATIKEIESLLLQIQDGGPLLMYLDEADESERLELLPKLSEEMIANLYAMQTSPTNFKVLIEKEYVCKLASDLRDAERLKKMWDLLLVNSVAEAEWKEAAAVVLTAFIDQLDAPLKELDQELLQYARVYLEARQDAIVFAEKFFKCDLGISTLSPWPPHGTGRILSHLAVQLPFGEEKLQLLVEALAVDREEAQSLKKRSEDLEKVCQDLQKRNEDLIQNFANMCKKQNEDLIDHFASMCQELQKRFGDLEETCKDLQCPSGAV